MIKNMCKYKKIIYKIIYLFIFMCVEKIFINKYKLYIL